MPNLTKFLFALLITLSANSVFANAAMLSSFPQKFSINANKEMEITTDLPNEEMFITLHNNQTTPENSELEVWYNHKKKTIIVDPGSTAYFQIGPGKDKIKITYTAQTDDVPATGTIQTQVHWLDEKKN